MSKENLNINDNNKNNIEKNNPLLIKFDQIISRKLYDEKKETQLD